jgi:hypothetical protein
MHHKKRKLLLAIPLMIGAALVTGYAFAAWTSTGSGTGEARSTTSINSVIAPGTDAPDLYPGSTSSVTVTVSNPNAYPVTVTSISAGSSALVNGTCTAGTVTSDARAMDVTGQVQSDNTTKPIAAGGSGTYTLVTHMSASAVDGCKLQTFTMPLTATLASA